MKINVEVSGTIKDRVTGVFNDFGHNFLAHLVPDLDLTV